MSTNLRKWLEEAGLSGRSLEVAMEACEANFMETVNDLRMTSKIESEYKETFPQSVIRVKISAALEKISDDNPDQVSAAPSPCSNEQKVVATTQSGIDESANTMGKELPAGKR